MPRFSKAVLTETVQQRLDVIQATHGFDPGNGTAQLKGKLGNVNAAIAYGEREALLRLAEEFNPNVTEC